MSLLRALSDRIFGYDVFISYSRQDASGYACALDGQLKRIGYRPFLDSQEMPPGEALTASLRNALARSSALVMVVSPGGLKSTYMPKEFDHYTTQRTRNWKIVPISIGRTLDEAAPDLPLAERLRTRADVIWISESADNLATGPSAETFKALIDGFHFTRRNTIRRRVMAGVSASLAVLAGVAILAAWQAIEHAQLALSRQLVAQSSNRILTQPDLALLLAVEAYEISPTTEATAGLAGVLGELAQLTGHEHAPSGPIERAAYSPDARYFAALSGDGVILWNVSPWCLRATLRDPAMSITSFAFDPDGERMVTCAGNYGLAFWRMEAPSSPETVIALPNAVRVVFAPDQRQVLAGTGDGHIFLVDPATKQVRDLGEAHHGFITAIVPDFARGKFYTAGMSRDRNVAVWDFATLRLERYFEGHKMSVNALSLNSDGRCLASAGEERDVIIWDVDSCVALRQFVSEANPVWKFGTPEPHGSGALDLAFLPGDNEVLAGYDDGRVLVWNLKTQKGGELRAHLGATFSLAAKPSSRCFASGGSDGKLRFWNLDQVHPAARILVAGERSRFLDFTSDGATLCAAEENRVRRWQVATGREESDLTWVPRGSSRVVAFSASANLVAMALEEGTSRSVEIRCGASFEQTLTLVDADAEPGKVALDPNGRWFASPSEKSQLFVWNLSKSPPQKVICQDAPFPLSALGAAQDGTWMLGCGREGPIKVWNPANGEVIASLNHPANYEAPTALAAHAGAGIVAAGYLQHGTLAFWNVRDPAHPRLVAVTHEHEPRSSINAVAWNRDGTRLLSLGSEGDAVLWQFPDAVPIARFVNFGDGYARYLPFNADGNLAAGSGAGGFCLFDLSPTAWKARARALAGRSLSQEEQRAFLRPKP